MQPLEHSVECSFARRRCPQTIANCRCRCWCLLDAKRCQSRCSCCCCCYRKFVFGATTTSCYSCYYSYYYYYCYRARMMMMTNVFAWIEPSAAKCCSTGKTFLRFFLYFLLILLRGGRCLWRRSVLKKEALGAPRFLIKKTHRATEVVFYIAHVHTHTSYTYIMVKFLKGKND